MFGPKGPRCQSCGMPLSKDEKGGGTNSDGSKTTEYCSKCYQMGQFTEPNITAKDMQEKVKGKLIDMGFPKFVAGLMAWDVPRLRRWSSK